MDIRAVSFEDHGLEIGKLRAQVWIESGERKAEQFPDGIWHDEFEASSYHWAAFSDGVIVASARLTIGSTNAAVPYGALFPKFEGLMGLLSRLVVSNEFRGRGIAKELDTRRIEKAREFGAGQLFGHFPIRRVKALVQLGFQVVHYYSVEECEAIAGGHYGSATMMMDL